MLTTIALLLSTLALTDGPQKGLIIAYLPLISEALERIASLS